MSPVEGYELLAGGPPLVPLAWNFVVPAFLGFLVGSTYVLTFGLIAAVVVWAGASVLFALWLVTGLYPFNRLALIGYAVGGALVLRAAGELLARAIRRGRGRVRIADLAERDRDWAGAEAIALMRLTRAGARVVPQIVVRGAPVVRADPAWSSAGRSFELLTRHPRGGPVCLARIEWLGGTRGADLDRVTARAIGPDAESAASELPLPACFALLDRAEAGGVGAARLFCGVTAEGSLEVSRCEPIARADWTDVWLAGAGVDLAGDPVSPLEQDITEAAWGWDRLLLARGSPDDVRFIAHRPYVSFESARGGARATGAARDGVPRRARIALGVGVLLRDLVPFDVGRAGVVNAAAPRGPHEAVARARRVCREALAPMHAWSALALRSLRWIEALVADRERRDDLLARIQAPEVRALEGIAADLAALSAELPLAELTGLESWKSVEERLQVLPDGERRCAVLRAFLAAHGHRGPGERTLAGARLSDGPHVLRVMAGEGSFPRRPPRRPSPDARSAGSILMWLDPLEWWVGVVAALGRFAIRRRVAARERATRGLGALRASLLVIGDELVVRDALASREDVFLLTLPEWRALLEAATDVRPVLERRRRAFGADASSPARAVVGAPETHRGPVDPGARVLRGVATSAGVARGRAIGPGRASMTGHTGPEARVLVLDDANPAHAGSLGSVAALVCERGGLLSHLAIVARELGLPAVMGVADAARVLAAGGWVEVDGCRGEVRLLDRAEVARAVSPPG